MTKWNTCDIQQQCEQLRVRLTVESHSHGWNEWRGEKHHILKRRLLPKAYEPIQMCWANGIIRTYDRADWIVWKNIPVDGTVFWRKP